MLIGAGAARWSRLALAIVLALLVPLAVDILVDDVSVTALLEQADGDDGICRPAPSEAATADLPVPLRPAHRPAPDDSVVAGWTGRTPTDRAPPRV